MHTFFINTSDKEFADLKDILEIQYENRNLISLDCPFSKWKKVSQAEDSQVKPWYETCVKKMGEMIDSYENINNHYNLIIYVDLIVFESYSKIPTGKNRERDACLNAILMLFKRYLQSTLVNTLTEEGRTPRQTLIIFEKNDQPLDNTRYDEDGKRMICQYIDSFIGLPKTDFIEKTCQMLPEGEGYVSDFTSEILENREKELIDGILDCYREQIEILAERVRTNCDMDDSRLNFFNAVIECEKKDDALIRSAFLTTNRQADKVNKQASAKRDLLLALYLYECVEDCSIYTLHPEGHNSSGEEVKPFPNVTDWDEIVDYLQEKQWQYEWAYKQTQALAAQYTQLELAPPLFAMDCERFSLDEFGEELIESETDDAEDEKDAEKERSPFLLKGYPGFSEPPYTQASISPNDAPEDMKKRALELCKYHKRYLNQLKSYVSEVTSSYSGASVENYAALLKKRKVSVDDNDFSGDKIDYPYALKEKERERGSDEDVASSEGGFVTEKRRLETVKDTSSQACKTAELKYLKNSATRSVKVTNIEEQYEWFVRSVDQITESLKNLSTVFFGVSVAMIAVYLPFVLIQFEAFFEDILAGGVAIASIGLPLAILWGVFGVLSAKLRKRYCKVWEDLVKQSQLAIEDNRRAVGGFDQMLGTFIPTLRWLYEYTVDVDFYAACCRIAAAKKKHHEDKLFERAKKVGNMIEDLEYRCKPFYLAGRRDDRVESVVDFSLPFSAEARTGDAARPGNKTFYSIIDRDLIRKLREKEE